MKAADRALATELVYGTLRRRGTIDYYLSRVSRRPLESLDEPLTHILRLAAYQMLYLDRIPRRAAVYEAVAQARRHVHAGAAGFVNGVLRNLDRRQGEIRFPDPRTRPADYLAAAHSHPRWLAARWLRRLGFEEAEALCRANNRIPPMTVRVNSAGHTPEGVLRHLGEHGIAAAPGRWVPGALELKGVKGDPAAVPGFREGLFTFQDEASMMVALILAPRPGEHVLDGCSAPGTKTGHAAELMKGEGRITAADIDGVRLAGVEENIRRLGFENVDLVRADARRWGETHPGAFHRILIDAPCTGLGTLARRPDLRWQKTEQQIKSLAGLQKEILASAAAALRPGGVIVYSTCTTEPEENEQVIEWFLQRFPEFREDTEGYVPGPRAGDLLKEARRDPGRPSRGLALWPHRHGTDGFFIARLQRGDRGG